MSILKKLTEGIVSRDLQREGTALLNKWERTGLLEGLESDRTKTTMSVLLENQAKELLRESSTMAGGDVEGFAAVAFPIVRRVFGSLIANDLVSVQPMSLPSGLIFFLDFTTSDQGTDAGETLRRLGYPEAEESLFGGQKLGHEITGGVNLDPRASTAGGRWSPGGFYDLNQGYSSPTASVIAGGAASVRNLLAWGIVGGADTLASPNQKTLDKLCQYDPDLSGSTVAVLLVTGSTDWSQFNSQNFRALATTGSLNNSRLVRRLTTFNSSSTNDGDSTSANWKLQLVYEATGSQNASAVAASDMLFDVGDIGMTNELTGANTTFAYTYAEVDDFSGTPKAGSANALGAVAGTTTWGLEAEAGIPEIDIRVDSVSVTAQTKKLKAKWSPELGQDLNAYHNLDAEVELTSILSEQIALEIDKEILVDLIVGAGTTYYWSRSPGLFVNRITGEEVGASSKAPDFTGTVGEWYETLLETVNDVSAVIHRKTLRGGANFMVCSPEVASILEMTSGFRASITVDADRGTAGAQKIGQVSKKWDVYIDPYFPRNVILVGRKGASFLESGYVYAPYVPLQVTPTIFGPEDFVPRKGVMTRYAKKMVRPDMYGLVIVRGLIGEHGG